MTPDKLKALREAVARIIAEEDVRTWSWGEDATDRAYEAAVKAQAAFHLPTADQILALISQSGEEEEGGRQTPEQPQCTDEGTLPSLAPGAGVSDEATDLEALIERLEERRRIMWNAPLKDGGFAKLVAPDDLSAAIRWLYRLAVVVSGAGGAETSGQDLAITMLVEQQVAQAANGATSPARAAAAILNAISPRDGQGGAL